MTPPILPHHPLDLPGVVKILHCLPTTKQAADDAYRVASGTHRATRNLQHQAMSDHPLSLLPENHHLEYRKERKTFRVKVTVVNPEGKQFTGKRILVPLNTGNAATARRMRDIVLSALDCAGCLARPFMGDDSTD